MASRTENGLVFIGNDTSLSPLDFLDRFTTDEIIAIRAAAKVSPEVDAWLYRFDRAQSVDIDDQRTITVVQNLEAAGLIAAGRAAEILA